MANLMGKLMAALTSWSNSQDLGSAGARVGNLRLSDRYDQHPPVDVELQELTADDLRYALAVDAAAGYPDGQPVAHHRDEVEAGDQLRFAAARLERLSNPRGLTHESNLGWPGNAAVVLTEIARASHALQQLVDQATEKIINSLRRGALVALPQGDGSRAVPNQTAAADAQARLAHSAVDLLGQAAATVAELAEQIARLQVTSTATGEGAVDGPTLTQEAILRITLPPSPNEGRYHVRIFRPPNARPLVLLSQLADHHTVSITNAAGILAETIAEAMLNDAAADAVIWVLVYPDGQFGGGPGAIEEVQFDGSFAHPQWGGLTHEQLEALAGGPVKRWHVSNYTLPLMPDGVLVLTPDIPPRRR